MFHFLEKNINKKMFTKEGRTYTLSFTLLIQNPIKYEVLAQSYARVFKVCKPVFIFAIIILKLCNESCLLQIHDILLKIHFLHLLKLLKKPPYIFVKSTGSSKEDIVIHDFA